MIKYLVEYGLDILDINKISEYNDTLLCNTFEN